MSTVPTDGELLMRFIRHQDQAAFETLVQRHQASVYGVCHRVLGNAHDAEDAFQATFLVLARKAQKLETASSIGGWLFRVALRTAKNALAKKTQWQSNEEALNVVMGNETNPLEIIQQQELVTTLYEELAKLPKKYQTPIVLCMLEGKSRLEASAELECTVASIKARLTRGRQQLRINLTRRGVAFSVAVAAISGLKLADEAVGSLCSDTAAACTSYMFAAESCTVTPNIIQLSEKGMSAMTLTSYLKLAAASVALITIGVGSATLPMHGLGHAQGADTPIDLLVSPQIEPKKAAFSTNRQDPAAPVRAATQNVANTLPEIQPTESNLQDAASDVLSYQDPRQPTDPNSGVSEQASSRVIQALIEALKDDEKQVAHNAAKTLISIGNGHGRVVEAFAKIAANASVAALFHACPCPAHTVG